MTDEQHLDPMMARIGAAIELGQRGERAAAADRFAELWDEADSGPDPLHRVLVAHYAADVQDEAAESLAWNLRALTAAGSTTDDGVRRHHPDLRVAAFYPSLHLNLARDYLTLGDEGSAREHVAAAEAGIDVLPDDGYGRMVRAGLARITADLAGEPAPAPFVPRTSCQGHGPHADHPHN
jgi:hypothetical protein